MKVYWLEQAVVDVPSHDRWLNVNEAARLGALRYPRRRADWRLGRWTAKRAVALRLNLGDKERVFAGIEVRAASSGAPEIYLGNDSGPITISLSHREGMALCAVASPEAAVGCDLELIENRSDAFIRDYLTAGEQALIADAAPADRTRLTTLLWSAKESALKALGTGLTVDTRSVAVTLGSPLPPEDHGGWQALTVNSFQGWWQQSGSFVRTLLAAPSPAVPIRLLPTP